MKDALDFYDLGRLDFPSHRHYPTRDRHTIDEETAYLAGWKHQQRQEEIDDDFSEARWGQDIRLALR